jgi:hypothetical protein
MEALRAGTSLGRPSSVLAEQRSELGVKTVAVGSPDHPGIDGEGGGRVGVADLVTAASHNIQPASTFHGIAQARGDRRALAEHRLDVVHSCCTNLR